MCGRITLTRPNLESIAAELDVEPIKYRGYPILEPRYKIAPTSILPTLTLAHGHRRISPMRWGVSLGTKRPVINLRAEAAPSREAFRERRCGVIADGFYECTAKDNGRQPFWFHWTDNALIVLAGLWQWQEVKEEPAGFFQVFAIITTRANVMAPIHDRMPVVFDTAQLDTWMNVASTDMTPTRGMLAPAPDDWLVAERVSTLVQ